MSVRLDLYDVFAAIAETKSITAAARRLRSTKATVSRSLARLEDELDTTLVLRSSRSLSLTAAGESLYAQVAPALATLRDVDVDVDKGARGKAKGKLRLTAAIDFGQLVLPDILALCRARHPALDVEVRLSNDFVDLTGEGFDVALRLATQGLRDSSLVAKKVGVVSLGVYAAPAYVARRGVPVVVGDDRHDWLVHGVLRRGLPRALHASVVANDMVILRELCVRGAGVAPLAHFVVADDIVAGRLVEVLPIAAVPAATVYVVQPASSRASPTALAFRDVVTDALKARPLP